MTRPADGQPGSLDGLVLLDLHDFDSRVIEHRQEAERILALVDVFVWVTDPQKYADARLHDDYLQALATHDTASRWSCCSDRPARRRAPDRSGASGSVGDQQDEGLRIWGVGAHRRGIDDLRMRLAARWPDRTRPTRLAADIRAVAGRLRSGSPTASRALRVRRRRAGRRALPRRRHNDGGCGGRVRLPAGGVGPHRLAVHALGAGVPSRPAQAPASSTRRQAGAAECRVTAADVRGVLGRSSLPPPPPRAAVDTRHPSRGTAAKGSRMVDAVDEAATPHRSRAGRRPRPGGHRHAAARPRPALVERPGHTQTLLALASVAGLLWLVVLGVIRWLQLPRSRPRLGLLPYPFLLLAGGLLLGLLLAVVARACARGRWPATGALINRQLRDSVTRVAEEGSSARAQVLAAPAARNLDRARATAGVSPLSASPAPGLRRPQPGPAGPPSTALASDAVAVPAAAAR